MPPAEKHILEIDSAELAFGERRILSGVYLLVETGGVTAVLGRNGCGKSCLMKILSGSLKAGFCSMRIDGKWHRRFTEKEIRYLPQHPFIPGWLRLERALGDFRLQREDLERWFPEFISLRGTRIGELSGGEQRILECFIILRSPARFILLDEPPIRGRGTARSGSATRPRTDPGRCFPDGSWRGSTCTPKWPRRHGSKPPKHPRRIGRNGRGPRPRNRPGSLRRHS